MSQKNNVLGTYHGRTNSELYKELEIINLQEQSAKSLDSKEREKAPLQFQKINPKSFFSTKLTFAVAFWKQPTRDPTTQLELFQRSMKFLLICGQIIGLNPVIGYLESDVQKIRFKYLSVRFIYSVFVLLGQTIATLFCIYRLFKNSVNITLLSFVSFYLSTGTTTLLFLRVASKWPSLMKDVSNSGLNKYVDVKVLSKLTFESLLLLSFALVEHILSFNTKMIQSCACPSRNGSLYEDFINLSFPWYAELQLPFYVPTGCILQFLNVISTINWSYSDVFIVCMSTYLTSILNQINKTIIESEQKYYHPAYWSGLREDYTKATRLIASFDNAISGIIFCSFATNLFFICLQLFYVFSNAVKGKSNVDECQNLGPFGGYEYFLYFTFSFVFVLGRFMAVSLRAAYIHSASIAAAPALYNLPSTVYCNEIQRFIEQVHGSTVALTGLQFFNVTKGLILTVAGTIVTYELVLIQFNGEDSRKN